MAPMSLSLLVCVLSVLVFPHIASAVPVFPSREVAGSICQAGAPEATAVHLDQVNGNDAGDGSAGAPVKTTARAGVLLAASTSATVVLCVAPGIVPQNYSDTTLQLANTTQSLVILSLAPTNVTLVKWLLAVKSFSASLAIYGPLVMDGGILSVVSTHFSLDGVTVLNNVVTVSTPYQQPMLPTTTEPLTVLITNSVFGNPAVQYSISSPYLQIGDAIAYLRVANSVFQNVYAAGQHVNPFTFQSFWHQPHWEQPFGNLSSIPCGGPPSSLSMGDVKAAPLSRAEVSNVTVIDIENYGSFSFDAFHTIVVDGMTFSKMDLGSAAAAAIHAKCVYLSHIAVSQSKAQSCLTIDEATDARIDTCTFTDNYSDVVNLPSGISFTTGPANVTYTVANTRFFNNSAQKLSVLKYAGSPAFLVLSNTTFDCNFITDIDGAHVSLPIVSFDDATDPSSLNVTTPNTKITGCPINCPQGYILRGQQTKLYPCLQCNQGQHSLIVNGSRTDCVSCMPGYFQPPPPIKAPTDVCDACGPGFFVGSMGAGACGPCDFGTYTGVSASTECVECDVGKYQDNQAAAVCINCPAGTYQSDVGTTVCSACGDFLTTTSDGQTKCTSPTGFMGGVIGGIVALIVLCVAYGLWKAKQNRVVYLQYDERWHERYLDVIEDEDDDGASRIVEIPISAERRNQ